MSAGFDEIADRRVFYAGDQIFSEGSSGSEMFIIESGRVAIGKTTAKGERVLGELGPGCVFGEMVLLDNRPRMAAATAIETTVCRVVSRKMFEKNMRAVDPLMRRVIKALTENVRSLSRELESKP